MHRERKKVGRAGKTRKTNLKTVVTSYFLEFSFSKDKDISRGFWLRVFFLFVFARREPHHLN